MRPSSPTPLSADDAQWQHTHLEILYRLLEIDPETIDDDLLIMNRMREVCEERNRLKERNALLTRDVDKLVDYMDQLQHDVVAIEQSRAWRIGYKVVSTLKLALGKGKKRYAFSSIHRTLTLYHHWKKSRD